MFAVILAIRDWLIVERRAGEKLEDASETPAVRELRARLTIPFESLGICQTEAMVRISRIGSPLAKTFRGWDLFSLRLAVGVAALIIPQFRPG